MKTDGTDKKKVAQIVNSGDAYRYSLFQSEGKIYYTKENENKTFYDLEGNTSVFMLITVPVSSE